MSLVQALGGEYLVVHFPFLADTTQPISQVQDLIFVSLDELACITADTGTRILLEPKVGFHGTNAGEVQVNPGGIYYLSQLGAATIQDLATAAGEEVSICCDVGDFFLAAQLMDTTIDALLEPLSFWIRSLHLHHVQLDELGRHIWTPIHPSPDDATISKSLVDLIPTLIRDLDLDYLVFEHTPHLARDDAHIRTGFHWIKHLLERCPDVLRQS